MKTQEIKFADLSNVITRSQWRKRADRAIARLLDRRLTAAQFRASVPASPDTRDPSPAMLLFRAIRNRESAVAKCRVYRAEQAARQRRSENYQRAVKRAIAAGRPVYAFRDTGWSEDVITGRAMTAREFAIFAARLEAHEVGVVLLRADGALVWNVGTNTRLNSVRQVRG